MNSEPLGANFKAFCQWESTQRPPPPPPEPVPILDKQGEQVVKKGELQWEEMELPPPPPPKMSYRAFCKLLRQAHMLNNDLTQLDAAELYATTADMSLSPEFEELDYTGFKKLVWHVAHKGASHLQPSGAFSRAYKAKLAPFAKAPAPMIDGPAKGDWVFDLPIHQSLGRAAPLLNAIFRKYSLKATPVVAASAGVGPNSAWCVRARRRERHVSIGWLMSVFGVGGLVWGWAGGWLHFRAADHGLDLDDLEDGSSDEDGGGGSKWPSLRMDHYGLLRLAQDYELCPQLLAELDVRSVSLTCVALRRSAGRADDDDADVFAVPDFVDALVLMAGECFGRPPVRRWLAPFCKHPFPSCSASAANPHYCQPQPAEWLPIVQWERPAGVRLVAGGTAVSAVSHPARPGRRAAGPAADPTPEDLRRPAARAPARRGHAGPDWLACAHDADAARAGG